MPSSMGGGSLLSGAPAGGAAILGAIMSLAMIGCAGSRPGAAPDGTPAGKTGGPILPWSGGGSLKFAYIRSDVISQTLQEYRDADNTLKAENAQWTEEVEKMESELHGKESQLEELKLILSPERRKQLEDEVTAARKEVQRYRQSTWYDESSRYLKRRKELMEPIDARVNDAIYKVAEARGLDIVLDTVAGNVVYARLGLDITDLVLEELQR